MLLATLGLVVGLVAWVLLREPTRSAELPAEAASPTAAEDEAGAGAALAFRMQRALRSGDPRLVGTLAAEGDGSARREMRAVAANIRELQVRRLSLRYIDESSLELPSDLRARYGNDAWVAELQLSWRVATSGARASIVEVPVVMDWAGGRAVVATTDLVGGYRVPLWFVERLQVRRDSQVVAVATGAEEASRLAGMARSAVRIVRRRLPLSLPLTVEWPRSQEQFETATGLSSNEADAIAAVTTTTDGSDLPGTPVHVYLNPAVFEPLGRRGQQIVVSHEAAHVALGAMDTSVPLWLSEGVADYVALADNQLPVEVLAAQARQLVRRDGPPGELPGAEEFNGTNEDIGAHYESAWIAARMLAGRYGEQSLFDLYEALARGQEETAAMREVLGVTRAVVVRQWQQALRELAEPSP